MQKLPPEKNERDEEGATPDLGADTKDSPMNLFKELARRIIRVPRDAISSTVIPRDENLP